MFDFSPEAGILHLIATFIAVQLVLFSFALSVFGGKRNFFNEASWKLLVSGAITAFLATITGLVGDTPNVMAPVSRQPLGFVGTSALIGFLIWRYKSRLRNTDLGKHPVYRGMVAFGLIWLILFIATAWNLGHVGDLNSLLNRGG